MIKVITPDLGARVNKIEIIASINKVLGLNTHYSNGNCTIVDIHRVVDSTTEPSKYRVELELKIGDDNYCFYLDYFLNSSMKDLEDRKFIFQCDDAFNSWEAHALRGFCIDHKIKFREEQINNKE